VAAGYFQRLEALFDEGVALPRERRAAWLDGLGLAPELRAELEALLAADDADSGDGRLTRRFGDVVAGAGDAPIAGQQLGPYRLVGELGSGGSGLVFLAERADRQFEQQVAIKVIRGVASAEAAKQLRHERQLLASFDHPGIARLFDGGETAQGQPWLVMEYVRGEPITEACRARGVPVRRRIALLAEVAHAVHYAHQRLVIHRDIKPGNVLMRDDGRPVLLDFGIAKLLDPAQSHSGQTQPWFTPAYASPEQRRGQPVSTATDVYALGLLLYELLTDTAPAADAEGHVPLPSRALQGRRALRVRGDLDRIVLRATAPEADRRYPSAEALAEDLERYLDGRAVRAVPDSVGYRVGKFLRRHPLGTGAVAAAVVLLSLLAWRLAGERDRALAAEAAAERESGAAAAVSTFLAGLFEEANPERARGASLTPVELVDRGLERLVEREDLSARERARLLATLGQVYTNLGHPVKATQALQEAVTTAEGSGTDPVLHAGYYGALGTALARREEYGAAEQAFASAIALARTAGDERSVAYHLGEQALMLSRQGRLAEAEPLLHAAIAARKAAFGPASDEAADAEMYLSELLRFAGRHEEAAVLVEEALAHLRALHPEGHPELLSALSIQAELLREMGDTAGAEAVLSGILAHRQAMLAADSELLALVHSALGSVYYEQGRTRDATAQFLETLRISERSFAADDPTMAVDYNNVASLYEEQGDYPAAEPMFRRAVAIMEQHPDDHLPRLAQFRQNLGRLLLLAGKAGEAREWLEIPVPEMEGEIASMALQRARQALHLAEWHRRYGDADDAARWLERVEDQVDAIGGRGAPRYAQALRTRALLSVARGAAQAAREDLLAARALLVEGRGERYVGVGELALDLAGLALGQGQREEAARWLAEAERILPPVVAPHSPQAAALAATRERLSETPL
jgi:serine/threonine-protein kinase